MFLKVEANEVHFFGIGQPAGDLLPSTAHKLLFHQVHKMYQGLRYSGE